MSASSLLRTGCAPDRHQSMVGRPEERLSVGISALIDLKLPGRSASLLPSLGPSVAGLRPLLLTAFLLFQEGERRVAMGWLCGQDAVGSAAAPFASNTVPLLRKASFSSLLLSSKQPLVGHNMLMDLLHLHEKFFRPLPGRPAWRSPSLDPSSPPAGALAQNPLP